MSLVDYASSSDDDVPEVGEEHEEEPEVPKEDQQPPASPRTQVRSGLSSNQLLESISHSSPPLIEKLPDASLLLNSPTVSNLMNASDHSSRVAAAMAENDSRKRDSNGLPSSNIRHKVPKSNLPQSRKVPDTVDGMLVPPQLSGRKNVVTEDIGRLFVKKETGPQPQ
ncbi:Glycerol-3-phosphate dehydrogenase [Quillaja saponaria]|uniref:Glycerol-3-phosphate dehydrogenase n=1 Tax=Quillaja saponaria TaxID=32244 RepID=A0AAD7QIS1_QUISA|nr:Glycerol-3-phosphate dehydrogenase [Quillaja saponaria]